MRLYTRKEIRAELNVSDSSLRRWIKELGIQSHNVVMSNGVQSKQINSDDYLKLVEYKRKLRSHEATETNNNNSLSIVTQLQAEVTNLRTEKLFNSKLLQDKEQYIHELKTRSQLAEERIDTMYGEIKRLNEELLKEKSKGFFKKIFS